MKTGPASAFHTLFRRAFERGLDDVASMCATAAATAAATTTTGERKSTSGGTDAAEALREAWRGFHGRYAAHTVAEDDVLFPTVASRIENVAYAYEFEHEAEEWLFEEVTSCLDALCEAKDENERKELGAKAAMKVHATRTTLKAHLAKESEHVLPMLEKSLTVEEQGELVWKFIAALPAREACDLLAWAAASSSQDGGESGGGESVEALETAMRAHSQSSAGVSLRRTLAAKGERARAAQTPIVRALFDEETGSAVDEVDDTKGDKLLDEPSRKRRRQTGAAASGSKQQQKLPIDHIFQFHNALRHELHRLEQDVLAISSTGTEERDARLVRMIDGRFVFLRGVYEAHSMSEDDIVFPALEAKSALHNVSHSYTLDHKQEAELIKTIVDLVAEMRATVATDGKGKGFRDGLVAEIQQGFAAMRVSLETHVAKEEAELWPMFERHFSFEEQEKIVGLIIGRTGAEVLHSMLIWVREALNDDESEGMISSMRHATQNTHFAQWMNTWYSGNAENIEVGNDWVKSNGEAAAEKSDADAKNGNQDAMRQVHAYLSLKAGRDVDKETFKPGWEDIFRMNQIQLEDAVRTVSRDDSLAPTKKAYLIQNLLASRWIVGNQLQAQKDKGKTTNVTENGVHASEAMCQPIDASQKDGCTHYKRHCQLVAPCCNSSFVCRFCHDDVSDHTINRYAVKEMMCMECGTRQPVANDCKQCKMSMAKYYCNVCNLFDDSGEAIYHCPFCNVCRRGKGLGVDFYHCMKCNACVSLQHGKHECSERGMDTECPVCKEFLADSETPVKELPCGHLMHATCFETYTRHYYTCPICRKSLGDFSVYFRMLDAILADEREDDLPDALKGKKQRVACNDCGKESDAKFHFVYHACEHCRSYNTRVLSFVPS